MDVLPDSTKSGVSIVLITRNRVQFLVGAVESLLAQNVQTLFEIIVVDNGSTDETVAVVREKFPGIRLICLDENLGVSAGRDLGIREAQYDTVMFMDDDALLESGQAVDMVFKFLAENPDVAVLAFRIVNDATGKILSHEFPRIGHTIRNPDVRQEVAYFVGCGFCLRRSVYESVGGFCLQMTYGPEEVDLSYRILEAGYRIVYFSDVTVRHRASPDVRRTGVWFRNEMQARFLLAVRNLPLWAAWVYMAVWHIRLFVAALMTGNVRWYVQGIVDGWCDGFRYRHQRRAISLGTAIKILRLGGRIFY